MMLTIFRIFAFSMAMALTIAAETFALAEIDVLLHHNVYAMMILVGFISGMNVPVSVFYAVKVGFVDDVIVDLWGKRFAFYPFKIFTSKPAPVTPVSFEDTH